MLRQVRNLRSCIKVALDFVSPESLEQLEQLARDRRVLALQETGPPDQKCDACLLSVMFVQCALREPVGAVWTRCMPAGSMLST